MKYSDYQKAFSHARLDRYCIACGGNKSKALRLYRYNIRLCQDFYAVLGVFEVVLRNAIDNHYQKQFCVTNWLEIQSQNNGVFNDPIFHSGNYQSKKIIQSNIKKLRAKYTHDRLVSSLSFGFWVMLYNKLQFAVCGKTLHNVFLKRPTGVLPRMIYKELDQIRDFRNRIAHHEPICFDAAHKKSIAYAQQHYLLMIKYVEWLGYNTSELFYSLDKTQSMINRIAVL